MYTIVTPAAAFPVSLAEFKEHLNYAGSEKDVTLNLYIKAATLDAEKFTGVQISEVTMKLSVESFSELIFIEKRPVISIEEIKYYNTANVLTVFDKTKYVLTENKLGYIYLDIISGETLPETFSRPDAVQITFKAGYTSVPEDIKVAILLSAASSFTNPSDSVRSLPTASKSLLAAYRSFIV